MDPVYKALAWSFRALNAGTYPHVDERGAAFDPDSVRAKLAGTPIAGSWRFLNFQHRGNLEMAANELELAHWQANEPCCRCKATKDT